MEVNEISDDTLDKINGGYMCSPNGTSSILVVDDHTGEELARFGNKMYAHMYCEEHGISYCWITPEQLDKLRNGERIW